MFFENGELSLELLGVFKVQRGKTELKSFNARIHDIISVRLDGEGYFKTEKRVLCVGRSDALYLPHSAHYTQKTEGETVLAVHFINYTFQSGAEPEVVSFEDVEAVQTLLLQMYRIWREQKSGYRLRCTALLYELLYLLHQTEQSRLLGSTGADARIRCALDYIHSHYRSENIEIGALARMCYISTAYFRRLFQRLYQASPKQYINHLRLEYAAQLLKSHLYTVSEISEKAGFFDVKYFSRCFLKRYGCSPRAYRNGSAAK